MGSEEDLRCGIEAGGDDYLIKPVSPVVLAAKIKAPALRVSNVCTNAPVSPPNGARLPLVIVGVPAEAVDPSYVFVSVAAVTVIARVLIVPIFAFAVLLPSW